MKTQQTTDTQCGCSNKGLVWGKAVGYGIAIGTLLGTAVGVATKQPMFVYVGMFFDAAVGFSFRSKQTNAD